MAWSNYRGGGGGDGGRNGGGGGGGADDWSPPAGAADWSGGQGKDWNGGGATSSDWKANTNGDDSMAAKDKIEALKNGYWEKDYSDFLYWCPARAKYVGSDWDDNLGRKGWWCFLWHEGQGWQPEALADHLEKTAGDAAADGGAADKQWRSGGDGWGGDSTWSAGDKGGWDTADDKKGVMWSEDPDEWAPNLDRNINWQGVTLVRVEKNFYEESPIVASHSPATVEDIRRQHDIVVTDVMGTSGVPNPVTTFEEASFPEWLQDNLTRHFEEPTAIQIQAWPVALQGRDLVGVAETGSGKTMAYLAPMMIHIMAQEELQAGEGPVGVVLAPTRELAIQIDSVAKEFVGASGLKSTCVYGGVPVREQAWAVQEKNDIIVATPGRLIHLLNEQKTNLNRVTYVVLDEADEMLSKGFGDQINLILSQVRPDRQMLMFSATWPQVVQALARVHCREEPVMIRVGGDTLKACRTITQKVVVIDANETGGDLFSSKMCKLVEALHMSQVTEQYSESKALIFCRTKANVDQVVQELADQYEMKAGGMHSDMDQTARMWTLDQFKAGHLKVLAATNCLGRGHDIKNVNFVINFDSPEQIEMYIHRVGRTGRAGNQGFSLTLLSHKDSAIAPDLIKVLESTSQVIPPSLTEMAKSVMWESDWAVEQNQAEAKAGGWDHYYRDAGAGQQQQEEGTDNNGQAEWPAKQPAWPQQ